jgi:LacI family transcriptional regulator
MKLGKAPRFYLQALATYEAQTDKLVSMSESRIKIEDVAAAAGVSTATVSRVLSRPSIVSAKRRAAVLDAVKALRYAPDQSARALASGRTNTIGCVVPSLDHAIFAKSTQALQTTLLQRGYHLLIASHEYDLRLERDAVSALQQRGVDALVLVGTDHLAETWRAIETWNKPTLLTWSCDKRLPSIGFDNRAVAKLLVEHLVALGHRRFGVISGYTKHNDRARARIEGVRECLAEHGLTLADAMLSEQSFNLSGGRAGLQTLFKSKLPPTAVICGNDLLAAGALLEAQRLGIAVPEQVSICGIDDHELARELNPTLTTVKLPTSELGRITANQIVAALSGEPVARELFLQFELVKRESTGPARRKT